MKKMIKQQFYFILLAFILVIAGLASSTLSVFAAQGGREGAAALAYSQINQTNGTKYGASSGAAWCAYFAGWCARNGGGIGTNDWPIAGGSTTILVDKFKNMGRWHDKCNTSWSFYKSGYGEIKGGGKYDGYTPQPGDFVAIDNNGSVGDGPDHTGIVYSVVGNTLTTIEGNISKKVVKVTYNLSTLRPTSGNVSGSTVIVGFGEPNYKPVNHEPVFHIESIQGGDGTISFVGWAYDPDEPSKSIELHVYIGGNCASPTAEGHGGIYANHYRPDVNNAFGITGNHGFSTTISTSKRGEQNVIFYALDTAGGTNPLVLNTTLKITDPLRLDFNMDSVTVNENETKTIVVSYGGENLKKIVVSWEGPEEPATCSWGQSALYSQEIRITGKKAGTNKLKVSLLDSNLKEVYSKSITVTTKHVHSYETYWTIDKKATCTATGSKSYHCKSCSAKKNVTTIPATGHQGGTATCSQKAKCSVCGAYYGSLKSHSYNTIWTIDKEATCTTAGSKSHHCKSCGEKKDVTTIPATGHQGGTATCSQKAKCSVCGAYYGSLKGHNYSTVWTIDKMATCTTTGSISYHCKSCSAKKDVTTILATGHQGGVASCTQKAKCDICGVYYGSLKDHNYSTTWTIDKEATCIEDGIKSHHCTVCNTQKDITVIKATGVHHGGTATCQEKAKCSVCTAPYGDYSAHRFENGVCKDCGIKTEIGNSAPIVDENESEEDNTDNFEKTPVDDEDYYEETPEDEFTDFEVESGDILEDERTGLSYEVTGYSDSDYTVEYLGSNRRMKTIIIPDQVVIGNKICQVTSIAEGAFENNKKVTKIVIGNNVVKIGSEAFSKCKNLRTVTMGKNVRQIGKKAFYACTKLTKIEIPKNVESIGKAAFYGCRKLKTIIIKSDKLLNRKIGTKAFKYINSRATINVPKDKASDYKNMLRRKGISSKVKVVVKG